MLLRGARDGTKKEASDIHAEFKAEAVDLVLVHGVSLNQTSRDLGVSTSTLGLWVQKARAAERGDTRRGRQARPSSRS
jgi:transposase-like protein